MTKTSLPKSVKGLIQYLSQPAEKSNEYLALNYFKDTFQNFTRQSDAKRADGYVAGHFVLELKGKTQDWYAGLFQGLAYQRELDFTLIIVAAKGFLGVWHVDAIPKKIHDKILAETAAPNKVGKQFAFEFKASKAQLYKKALWCDDHLANTVNNGNKDTVEKIKIFEQTVNSCKKIRQRITTENFVTVLPKMVEYFDPKQPIKAVGGFYTMIYSWDKNAVLKPSCRNTTQASLEGKKNSEVIRYLIPDKRIQFKQFVENYYVDLDDDKNSIDAFFAKFDKALDSVDRNFRIQHGIFFTDLDLARFAMWFVKKAIDGLGENYIVIDPACGSGNLVSSWRSPLQLRYKIVSEIEPELLFAVDKRLRQDAGSEKVSVVPKVAEGKGLNFLDKSASEYIAIIKKAIKEEKPDFEFSKPIAFLCNPPYRGDDDRTASSITYPIDPDIISLIGEEAKAERYCCFLAQMKLICDRAIEKGLPGDSRLILFTKTAWLTDRPTFSTLKKAMLSSFDFLTGFMVNGHEFFDVKGKFPIAFTVWKYLKQAKQLSEITPIKLIDLTWLRKSDLACLPWHSNDKELAIECEKLEKDARAKTVSLDIKRNPMKYWIEQKQKNFKRSRRKSERSNFYSGGLPTGDKRLYNKCVYGEQNGMSIGFMDDLTPCRKNIGDIDIPWFRFDTLIMRCNRARCFSGSPDHYGYKAFDLTSAKKTFLCFALMRTFAQIRYPLWADALELWVPTIPASLENETTKYTFAIGFAENECVETSFPAHNPIAGVPEIYCANPMAPTDPDSFWSKLMAGYFSEKSNTLPDELVHAVNALYDEWIKRFKFDSEIPVSYSCAYFIGQGKLKKTSGIIQIRDYAQKMDDHVLLQLHGTIQKLLKETKQAFYNLLIDENSINYFGVPTSITEKRLTLAAAIVNQLSESKGFGRTKLAKVFYLVDMLSKEELKTTYHREAAGPVDYEILYGSKRSLRIEALAERRGYFSAEKRSRHVHYQLGKHIAKATEKIDTPTKHIITLFTDLNTEEAEIVATLFACWNDFLIDKKPVTDELIFAEVRNEWHFSKKRFSDEQLRHWLSWMREHSIIPVGQKQHTLAKADNNKM